MARPLPAADTPDKKLPLTPEVTDAMYPTAFKGVLGNGPIDNAPYAELKARPVLTDKHGRPLQKSSLSSLYPSAERGALAAEKPPEELTQ
jgi:hypothetical protein